MPKAHDTQDHLVVRGDTTFVDVISELRAKDGSLAAREQKVADFVKANLSAISGMTIAAVAEGAEVSTPTVIRFCRSLNCEGFREFKLRLAQNLAVSQQYLSPRAAAPAGRDTPLDHVLGGIQAATLAVRAQIAPEDIAACSGVLVRCRQMIAAGIGGGSSMLALEASNRMFRLGIASSTISDSYVLQMRAATLEPGDAMMLFSSSGEADAVVHAARVARSYGARTICITRPGSRLAQACDLPIGLEMPEDPDIFKPTASRFASLAILDAIALSVAHSDADRTRENLRRIRASLTAYHGRTDPQPLGD
ncbi:MurR/RpiR family transcriptional regulator [Paracoccus sediminilitoris]|uniref:MurR/RpiR family transcriptional regulator n=1 Tax=Paracoccus sediminilitoris TaxID=2202419 RepID=UPI001F38B0F2|nr:MurR/RpiR family transcriptional regulator [Paracoccus sediminilitoris]